MASEGDDMIKFVGVGCGGCCFLFLFIALIVILTNIYNLGPEDQVVIVTKTGREVVNGPTNQLLNPFKEKLERKAVRLGPRNYAVVKSRQGEIRHINGPNLVFLGPWDELQSIQTKIILQRMNYIRLVNRVGIERVVEGPMIFTPEPLERAPNGTEEAYIISPDSSAVVHNVSAGTRRLEKTEGIFVPGPYEHVSEVRKAVVVGPTEYCTLRNTKTGARRNIEGPDQVKVGAWEVMDGQIKSKIVLQRDQYIRLVNNATGEERVKVGPGAFVPDSLEVYTGVEQMVKVNKTTTIRIRNATADSVADYDENDPFRGLFAPGAFERIDQVIDATVLDMQQFGVVVNGEGIYRHVPGPTQLRLKSRERLEAIRRKILLEKDQYVRLVNKETGLERVEIGPQLVVPDPAELKKDEPDPKVETAIYLDDDTAVLIQDKDLGRQRLVTAKTDPSEQDGATRAWIPDVGEYIIEIRRKRRVLPFEAVVFQNEQGAKVIKNPGEHFFYPPYSRPLVETWSSYDGKSAPGTQVEVTSIDLRSRKIFFSYERVSTQDSVKFHLDGTIYWRVKDVAKMLSMTSDPEGNVWQHARSALIAEVGKVTWEQMIQGVSNVTERAKDSQKPPGDMFYEDRGIEMLEMEINGFEPMDERTRQQLQTLIETITQNLNKQQKQKADNEVRIAKMKGDIDYEQQRSELLRVRKANTEARAQMEGEAEGLKEVSGAAVFIQGLNVSVPNEADRIELFKMREEVRQRNIDTARVASMSSVTLFLNPEDLNMGIGREETA